MPRPALTPIAALIAFGALTACSARTTSPSAPEDDPGQALTGGGRDSASTPNRWKMTMKKTDGNAVLNGIKELSILVSFTPGSRAKRDAALTELKEDGLLVECDHQLHHH